MKKNIGKHIAIVVLLLVFLGNVITCLAQTKSEISKLENVFEVKEQKDRWQFAKKDNTNELQYVVSGLFLFYKTFISSQDVGSCVFTPSCSVFAIKSIKQKGMFVGIMAAFDRLTRCNAFSPEQYPVHHETGLFHDPVE